MNQLSCQSCGSPLQVDGFDRRLAVVHCSHCGVLFDLTKPRTTHDTDSASHSAANVQPAQNVNVKTEDVASSRPVAAMPPGFSVTGNGQLSVRWSWRSISSLFLLGFAVLWNLLLLFKLGSTGIDLIRGVFALAGFGLLYRGLAGVLNSTTITVNENQLTVRHSPMPWYPAPTIDAASIEQLFVSEGYTQSKNGTRTPYYLLNAVLRDNASKRLSTRFSDIGQALYLEQEFERVLHIRDRSVAGEVRGTIRNI
ncbi:hypothetical protein IMCC3135_13995 [Granulosicoccus antarcticus IMCC3135]|uniref:Uncharacterized protein n=2 Tax=Granulosicoccus TaxID=437504 RepID=A0A2Z2P0C9_9GAMM|nr:hypothetical protein IMCC3135_13995 [Granulosicoccus antarcticus IMCC3135]